jgi:hypothetical protein
MCCARTEPRRAFCFRRYTARTVAPYSSVLARVAPFMCGRTKLLVPTQHPHPVSRAPPRARDARRPKAWTSAHRTAMSAVSRQPTASDWRHALAARDRCRRPRALFLSRMRRRRRRFRAGMTALRMIFSEKVLQLFGIIAKLLAMPNPPKPNRAQPRPTT